MSNKDFTDRLLLLVDHKAGGVKARFAELLRINPSYLNRWVNDGSLPSAEHLANMAEKLNVNINWLLTGKGPMYIDKSQSPVETPELSLRSLKIGELYENADDELRQIVDRVLAISPKPPTSGGKKK